MGCVRERCRDLSELGFIADGGRAGILVTSTFSNELDELRHVGRSREFGIGYGRTSNINLLLLYSPSQLLSFRLARFGQGPC